MTPPIYTENVVLIFSSLLLSFAVFWGVIKALKVFRR